MPPTGWTAADSVKVFLLNENSYRRSRGELRDEPEDPKEKLNTLTCTQRP